MKIVFLGSKNKGGGTMKRFLKRIHRGNKGFTLIELLIVIAIIGVLAAVVLPNVIGFIGRGETEAAKTELVTVQTAVDTMMADKRISTIPGALATAENDMSKFPTAAVSDYSLYPNYLRTATSSYHYTCTSGGIVTQTDTPTP